MDSHWNVGLRAVQGRRQNARAGAALTQPMLLGEVGEDFRVRSARLPRLDLRLSRRRADRAGGGRAAPSGRLAGSRLSSAPVPQPLQLRHHQCPLLLLRPLRLRLPVLLLLALVVRLLPPRERLLRLGRIAALPPVRRLSPVKTMTRAGLSAVPVAHPLPIDIAGEGRFSAAPDRTGMSNLVYHRQFI